MADKYQAEITKMLHSYQIFTRHERAIPIVNGQRVVSWNVPDRSSPDLTGGLVHLINVEVKTGNLNNFPFSKITEGQFEYAKVWREKRGCEYWFAIVIPTVNPIHGRLKRGAFLVPYPELISTMIKLEGIQKSIPYQLEKGMSRKLAEQKLYASYHWSEFELDYDSKRKWSIPGNHPFAGMYLNQKPYLYKKQ